MRKMKRKIFSVLLVLVVLSLSLVIVGPMATPALAATPHMVMGTGSYTGNATDDRSITGVGFQPDVVFIKGDLGQPGVFRTSTMVGDASKSSGSGTALFTNRIQSFGVDGFTIGTDADVNSNTQPYYWVAFKAAAGEMKVGSYTGDGAASHDITDVNFQPDYVIVMAAAAEPPVHATSSLSATSWVMFNGTDFTTGITAMLANGFRVGNHARVNTNLATYHYIAWKAVSGRMQVGSYTGDGTDNRSITGVGFQPDWLIIQRATASDAQHKPISTGASTDSSQLFSANGNASNRIQALESDGFQVGTRAEVNSSSGSTTYYYMAFNVSYTITVTPTSGLTTTEAAGEPGPNTFTIVLDSPPTADVTIGLTSSNTAEGTVSPASVTFTTGNWNTNQTVTVTGVDDLVADGNIPYTIVTAAATSTDPNYSGFDASDVSVTNNDDDTAGITVSLISGDTTEAVGIATFTIVLDTQPTADVTIGLTSSDLTEGTVLPASVTFTAGNWNTPQTVTVTGVNDLVADGNIPYTIVTAAATSTDPNYSGLDASDVSVTNNDDDTAGITVTPTSGLVTTEALGTANFTIVLNSEPTDTVTIDLSSYDTSEGTVSPASVTFTAGNWNTPQTITVTGVDDAVIDGNIPYTIVTAAATSTDPNYNGLDASDVSVTNNDNDTAGITVSLISGDTTEAGGTADFTIVLDSEPTDTVTIDLSSDDTSEGTVLPASVTFTAGNWNTPQTITVTGVDDLVADGNIAYTIVTAAATSTDPSYNGLDASDVSVTNNNNDIAGGGSGGGGGGGGGGGENTTLLNIDILGKVRGVQVTNDGITVEPSIVVSPDNNLTLRLDKGTKMISVDSKVPLKLALTVAKGPPPTPDGMVLVSQVYDCVAYSSGGVPMPVNFNPSVRLQISYNPQNVPENALAIFIAYYDEDKGWVRLDPPGGFVAEAGTAAAQVGHFTPFAVLAELVPPPPAYFEVRNLDISPGQVGTGENVIISAQIANTGGVSGEYTLMVNVEGLLETSQVITLAPEQSQEVSFTVTSGTPGSYQVEIGGLQGNFVVVAPPPAAEAGGFKWLTTWLTAWWLIPALVTMAIAALALILVRKRRQPAIVVEEPSGPVPTVAKEQPREPIPTAAEEPREQPVPVLSTVRNLKIIPDRVKPGETIYIFAEATNNGPTASSFSLVLKVRGVVEAVKEITLGPGQSQKVAFRILRDKPGVYDVDLEGLKGSFTVEI